MRTVNRSRCSPVVSTSVAPLTEICRTVGCSLDVLSPTRLSPSWFVAQVTGDHIKDDCWAVAVVCALLSAILVTFLTTMRDMK